jgi:glycosyltransferase involved in cell wall biosynthesis
VKPVQAPATVPGLEPTKRATEGDDGLEVRLESFLPPTLPVGRGSALFVYGSCFHPRQPVIDVRLTVNGAEVEPNAQQMPRTDLYEMVLAGRGDDGEGPELARTASNAYRSAFWGFIEFPPSPEPRVAEIGIAVTLEGGERREVALAPVELDPAMPEPARPTTGQQVAICMATFNPPDGLFERQIESIRNQTHTDWVCVISDDHSRPDRFAYMERVIGDDPRFILDRSPKRLGFYHNFERALWMAPASASFVAFADQDDRWYPEKLEVLLGRIGKANLVYSDMRIVDGEGREISSTYWSHRRNAYKNLASVLLANTITGAASLFRRDLLEYALPFPPRHGDCYHDHWIALVALTLGDVRYVDRPLYEYVQHGGAAIGHALANRDQGTLRGTNWVRRVMANPRSHFVGWRDIYFWDYIRMLLVIRILYARCASLASRRKRNALSLFLATERSRLAVGWLILRRFRRFFGATETLDRELRLLYGIAWYKAIVLLTGNRRVPRSRLRNDAKLPPSPADIAGPLRRYPELPWLDLAVVKTEPLRAEVREGAPERINILIPEFDLKHLFGGYIAKLNLASALARRGLRVRLVAVDRGSPLPADWREQVQSFSGLEGLFDRVEITFPRETREALEMSPRDGLLASTWWTAYAARDLLGLLERERFVYLIQEYEPFTFPMGSMAALAEESYRFPHFAVFSSELLRNFFRQREIGVFAEGHEAGERSSVSFENAITAVAPPSVEDLAARKSRRLLFYARPEPHAARNMFELGLMSLFRAASQGSLSGWEVCGIGSVDVRTPWHLELGAGVSLKLLPRQSQISYGDLLKDFDAGLALMYTPHPSLVPLEMASAGMLVVTNSFENKTPEAMAGISENLIVAEPSLSHVAAAVREAVVAADDYERRVRGAAVRWPTDWRASFNDDVIDRIAEFLTAS